MKNPKHAEPITIFRGDDTDFVGNRIIEISLDTDIDLSGITARFELCGFTQEFDNEAVAGKRLEVVIDHDTTKTLPLGAQNGSLVLFDASGKIKHVDTCIPFIVTNTTAFPSFTGDEQITCELRTKVKWSDIADTPTTLEGYGIEDAATSEELSEVKEAISELDRSVVKTVNGKEPDENGNVEVETGGGGTTDYNNLENKPSINGMTLSGNKTASDLGLATTAQGQKANSAYQKPQTGIPASDMSSAVQTSLGKADSSVQPSDLGNFIPYANPSGDDNRTSVAIGYLASVIRRLSAGSIRVYANAIALGRGAKVWANGGVAIGQYGIAADEDAVVITANLVGDQTYPSHGIGTLNFGSRSGMRGIFIQHMHIDAALAFLLANIDERGNVNSFLCEYGDWQYSYGEGWVAGQYFSHGGRLYKVLQNIEEYTEWEDVPPTSYEEITLQKVLFASPAFTGTPTAPTPAAADNSTKVATTAFVKTAISGISVTPLSGRTFDFATTQGVMDALKATIEALGGTVTNAPTTPAQNNQTQGE